MRSLARISTRAFAWAVAGGVAIVAAGGTGCTANKETELISGVLTQMQVPRDINGIQIAVLANGGAPTFCEPYYVTNGAVDLPATLGIVPAGAPETIVTVVVSAYNDADTNPTFGDGQCPTSASAVGTPNGPAIVRASKQTYVAGHELYLPMPLRFSCQDTTCSDGASCAGAQCVPLPSTTAEAEAVAQKLVDFNPALVQGTDECFSPQACFPAAIPAIPVDLDQCVFEVPPGAPVVPGAALNVRVFYSEQQWAVNPATNSYEHSTLRGGEVEILDKDPVEGFISPPAAAPPDAGSGDSGAGQPLNLQFQLAPGLCTLVHHGLTPPPPPPPVLGDAGTPATFPTSTYVTITDVQVSALCTQSKVTLLPICQADSTFNTANLPDGGSCDATDPASCGGCVAEPQTLVQSPSSLYAVMDDSAVMGSALGPKGSANVLSLSLADPIFQRTLVGFRFLPHDPNECPGGAEDLTTTFAPTIPFSPANTAQVSIAEAIATWTPPDTVCSPLPLDLLAAMRANRGAYGEVSALYANSEAPDIAGVMFFVNRVPEDLGGGADAGAGTGAGEDAGGGGGGVADAGCDAGDGGGPVECPIPAGETTTQAFVAAANAAYAPADGGVSVRTFFVVLANDAEDPAPFSFFSEVANEALAGAVTTIDARSSNAASVLKNFSSVLTELGTCLYDLPTNLSPTEAIQVQYLDPTVGALVTVPQDPSCNAATQSNANGWNFDANNTRIRICGEDTASGVDGGTPACAALRNAVVNSAAVAMVNGLTAPNVPIVATALCGGSTPDIVNSGATPPEAGVEDGGAGDASPGDASVEDANDAGLADADLDATATDGGVAVDGDLDAAPTTDGP
jgi:hypothetical protein